MVNNTKKSSKLSNNNYLGKDGLSRSNPSHGILGSNTRTEKSRVLNRAMVSKTPIGQVEVKNPNPKKTFPSSTPNPSQSILPGYSRTQRSNVLARPFVKKRGALQVLGHKIAPNLQRDLEHSQTLMRKVVKSPLLAVTPEATPTYSEVKPRPQTNHVITDGLSRPVPLKRPPLSGANNPYGGSFVKRINDFVQPAQQPKTNDQAITTSANAEVHLRNLEKLAEIEDSPIDDADIFAAVASKLSDTPKVVLRRQRPKFYHKIAKKLDIAVTTLAIGFVGIVLVAGFIASLFFFSNNIALYYAEFKSGVNLTMPNFTPQNFKLTSIKYATAVKQASITLTYKDGDQQYAITANKSSFDSEGLVSSVLEPLSGGKYQTYQVGGRTVYSFNDYFFWVSGGIYYQILNETKMSNNQVLQIIEGT